MLSFFPLDVLDEIWDLIESVSEGFLTYSWIGEIFARNVVPITRPACTQSIIEVREMPFPASLDPL